MKIKRIRAGLYRIGPFCIARTGYRYWTLFEDATPSPFAASDLDENMQWVCRSEIYNYSTKKEAVEEVKAQMAFNLE
jgi:hypothetical protein